MTEQPKTPGHALKFRATSSGAAQHTCECGEWKPRAPAGGPRTISQTMKLIKEAHQEHCRTVNRLDTREPL